jgi:hypothetical protein
VVIPGKNEVSLQVKKFLVGPEGVFLEKRGVFTSFGVLGGTDEVIPGKNRRVFRSFRVKGVPE